ncbi:nuclear transport factor 2 family protein [Pseudactinotalea sp. Z1748]|uniref:nuclear transport factor 2 family protein n=1 Tax=Pseudactinotalea sp. Z1748 TaxID=3413027 RepID=UPI003C7C739B
MAFAEELLHRHIDAFNAADPDRLLADFTPSATWITGDYTVPGGELRSFFEGAMRSIRPRLALTRTIDGGNTVVAEMTETWTHGGESKSATLVAVFDLVGGKIDRAKIYREGSADV